ncbi:MAG: cytochrome C, partial [Gammaproteobacteria bacterium]|nr:cytochrome C [Gammaproteobacteria bacterium]
MQIEKIFYGGMFRRLSRVVISLSLLGLAGLAQANVYDEPKLHPAIPLLDESGTNVLTSGNSYSAKQSCGGCHDYESITHSYHFETGRDEAADDFGALRGLPQLVSSGYFGGYNCMGSNNPDQLAKKSNSSAHEFADKGAAGWVQRCESCHTGGGWMEKDRNGNRYDETDPATVTEFDGDYYNRGTDEHNHPADSSVVSQWDWKKSGVVEADCFKCHADLTGLKKLDPDVAISGRTRTAAAMVSNVRSGALIDQGHFRESNTAILEVLNLNTTDDEALDKTVVAFNRADQAVEEHDGTVTPADGVISDKEVVLDATTGEPQLTWNTAAFDPNDKVEIPMLRFPGNDNCLACHRTSNSRRGSYGFGAD